MSWYKVSIKILVSLSFFNWIEFIFDPTYERETIWNFIGCQVPHCMIVLIPYINLLNTWILKWLFFEEYGAFNG